MGCTGIDTTIIKLDNTPTSSPTVTFRNGTVPQAPAYEACVGDSIVFDYDAFSAHPDKVVLQNQAGDTIEIPVTHTPQPTNNGFKGTISFIIPSNAATGILSFWDGTTRLYTTSQLLIIHNPILDFLPQTTPLCADDTAIPLYATPSGGTFAADTSSSFINTFSGFIDSLTGEINATQAQWPTNHVGSLAVDVTYSYLPEYSNGDVCTNSINTTKTLTFYDNRLNSINFATIVKQTSGGNNRLLTLDSTSTNNIITQITPNILCGSSPNSCYPYTFSGTYVDPNSNFLGNIANTNNANPVHLEFNNNGCIGAVDGDITVNNFSNIYGLPDKMCRSSSSTISRDPNLRYSNNSIFETNDFKSVTVNGNTIPFNATMKGFETFTLNTNMVSSMDTIMIVEVKYVKNNLSIMRPIDSTIIIDTIIIVDRPSNTLAAVPDYFCPNDIVDTLTLLPDLNYDTSSTLYFSYIDPNSNRYQSSLLNTNIISPKAIYDSLSSTTNQNVSIWLDYRSDYYGCSSYGFKNITIVAPLD